MFRRSYLFAAGCIVAMAVCSLCLVWFLAGVIFCGVNLRDSMKHFSQRHLEATAAINRVYEHFHSHGQWPVKADIEGLGKRWMPCGWEYEGDPEQGGPVIWLHGPNHMILSYRFTPPQHGAVSNTWTLSVEGDKTQFQSDIAYSLEVGGENPPSPNQNTDRDSDKQ